MKNTGGRIAAFCAVFFAISVQSQPSLTVFWKGKDITNKPTLIYHDEVETFMYTPPPRLINPNGTRGLLCSSTASSIAWYPGNGATTVFDRNVGPRIIYQMVPSGNLMAQIFRDGRNDDISGSDFHNGLFTCRRNGDIGTAVPVGFYRRGGGTERGVIRITGARMEAFMATPPSFTLTGDTDGGPPETYNWTRNGAPITNGGSFSISIGVNGVTDPSAYDRSRYRSTLTVTGTQPGMYRYSVSNRATPNTLTSNIINIEGAGATAPSNLTARQNGVGSILVSWTLPSLRPVDGYRISIVLPPDFSGGIDVGRDDLSRQINLALGMHSVSMTARSRHYPGMVVGPVTVTVLAFERPIIMLPSVTANNSVTLSWAQPDGSLPIENYVVSLQRGSNQPFCSDEIDSRQMNTNDQSFFFPNLYGSSSYTATVIARAFDISMMRSRQFMTPASPPVGVPQRIRTSTTSRTITVNWDEITCRERNGVITNYLVELKKEGVEEPIPGMLMMINERRFFANGSQIIPFTNYTFRVAGRNMEGQGPYSEMMTIQTMEDFPGPVSFRRSKVRFTSIDITWDRPREPNGIILRYEISYRVNDSTSPITDSTTNPNDTITFRIPALTLGTRVSVSVSAYTSVGQGPANLTNLVTLSETPVATGVQVVTIDETSVRVSWNRIPLDEITNYTVYYRPVGSRKRQVGEMAVVVPGSQVSVEIRNLQMGTRYQFQVEATALLEDGRRLTGQRSPVVRQGTTTTEVPVGAIVGAVIAVIAAVAVIIFVIFIALLCFRMRRNASARKPTNTVDSVRYQKTPTTATELPLLNAGQLEDTEPLIEEFPEDTNAIEGEGVCFNIVVSGKPNPSIAWYHNEDEVTSDYSMEVQKDGTLSIPSVELKHGGIYKMVAKNIAGSAEQQVQLRVTMEAEKTPEVERHTMEFSPIPVAEFGDYVVMNHNNQNKGFRDIFQGLESGDDYSKSVGLSPEYKKLNRFANITVYDHNRIMLNPIPGLNDCKGEFVNGCYIDGYSLKKKFIATQGPIPKTLVDFWRLIWQEKPPTIVMVTNLKEGNKKKCEQYWPVSGTANFGPFKVTITENQIFADYCIRTMQVLLEGSNRPHKLKQFHFTAWPDHGVPDYATPMLNFHRRVNSTHNPRRGPILVHCSAGVGRTGTFICIDYVLEQLKKENVIDIAGAINKMRHQRMKMVQTPEQLIFLHDAILESVTCGNTQITAADLRVVIGKYGKVDPSTGVTYFQSQFDVLEKVSPKVSEVVCSAAKKYPERNRRNDFLPPDRYRVIVKGEHPDYIHAVFAPGYKQQKAYIVAEGPMASTVRNMLKILYDRKCGAVVMLSDLIENGSESSIKYWPASGQLSQFGEYTVDLIDEEVLEGFTIRTLSILEQKSQKAHQVNQFHITCWDPSGRCSNLRSVVDAVDEVEKIQRRTGNKPVFIHCSDTVTRSGMFCAIATIIDRCKTEGVVDVFQVVKALRVQKPGGVPTLANYRTIYDATLTFLDSFDTYANFQNV